MYIYKEATYNILIILHKNNMGAECASLLHQQTPTQKSVSSNISITQLSEVT